MSKFKTIVERFPVIPALLSTPILGLASLAFICLACQPANVATRLTIGLEDSTLTLHGRDKITLLPADSLIIPSLVQEFVKGDADSGKAVLHLKNTDFRNLSRVLANLRMAAITTVYVKSENLEAPTIIPFEAYAPNVHDDRYAFDPKNRYFSVRTLIPKKSRHAQATVAVYLPETGKDTLLCFELKDLSEYHTFLKRIQTFATETDPLSIVHSIGSKECLQTSSRFLRTNTTRRLSLNPRLRSEISSDAGTDADNFLKFLSVTQNELGKTEIDFGEW